MIRDQPGSSDTPYKPKRPLDPRPAHKMREPIYKVAHCNIVVA
jgi:hypothetical protein